ncbi:unnamed protein product, partial [Chrysoparadoxa australica]
MGATAAMPGFQGFSAPAMPSFVQGLYGNLTLSGAGAGDTGAGSSHEGEGLQQQQAGAMRVQPELLSAYCQAPPGSLGMHHRRGYTTIEELVSLHMAQASFGYSGYGQG